MNARPFPRGTWRAGLDRLLMDGLGRLSGRSYGLLSHAAAVSVDFRPAHLALAAAGAPPAALFAPEHGFHGVEQDMVPAEDGDDPATGLPIRSLYGAGEGSLTPSPDAFEGLDLLLIDLQDVGARYYTYAATAVWAAGAALEAGCEVWVLDRPNPLGGLVEGNLLDPDFSSFVGAFRLPVRHGLTLGEVVRLEARRRGWREQYERRPDVWPLDRWHRDDGWGSGRAWLAPSPNLPTLATAAIYPGLCLIEATTASEGRGTTRPFHLVGAPGLDADALTERLRALRLPGVAFVASRFRPGFRKHAGEVCAGVEIVVTEARAVRPYRLGVEVLFALREVAGDDFAWRSEPYEFVADRPAIDLLSGGEALRHAVDAADREALDGWIASWSADEAEFRDERASVMMYGD